MDISKQIKEQAIKAVTDKLPPKPEDPEESHEWIRIEQRLNHARIAMNAAQMAIESARKTRQEVGTILAEVIVEREILAEKLRIKLRDDEEEEGA